MLKKMQAYRNTYHLENNTLIINLPESFSHRSVEVIVLPAGDSLNSESNLKKRNSESIKRLLSLSVWDDTDEKNIKDVQKKINQWKIEEF